MEQNNPPPRVHIGIFGQTPETVKWLKRKTTVILHRFENNVEMEKQLDANKVSCSFVLIRAPGITGLLPITLDTYGAAAFLLDDPPSGEALAKPDTQIKDTLRVARALRKGKPRYSAKKSYIRMRPGVEYPEQDGVPGAKLRNKQLLAQNEAQALAGLAK